MATNINFDINEVPAFSMYKKTTSSNDGKKKRKRKPGESSGVKIAKKRKTSVSVEQPKKKSKNLSKESKKSKVSMISSKESLLKKKRKKIVKIVNDNETNGDVDADIFSEESLKTKGKKTVKKNSGKTNGIDLIHSFKPTPLINAHPEALNESTLSDNPLSDAQHVFKWLIDPIPPEVFFKKYWEQKTLHIKRSNEEYYTYILNSSALDKIIRTNRLNYTQNVDVVSYENGVKEVHNIEGRVNPSALWDYYSNGCSIRILNPQTYSHKVHLLLATLQEYFGTMVGANVYLTPPNSQGFAPHYDDIEAFIIQLEGQKHWKLYQPKKSEVLARFSSPNLQHDDIGDPFMELTLNAGEMLYFPRGTIHEGRTTDSHSLHITVSVYQQTSYTDLLQHILSNALKKASENNIEYRRGLPLNYLKHFGIAASSENTEQKIMKTKIEELISSLIDYVDIDSAADQLGKKFMHDSMPPILTKDEAKRCSKVDGAYLNNGEVVNRVCIDSETSIRLLRYYCIRLVNEENSNPKLYYNTENANVYHGEDEQWLELDPAMVSTIRVLQNTYPNYITLDKLPMEDEELKLQLISDLWEHGLIVTEESLKPLDDDSE